MHDLAKKGRIRFMTLTIKSGHDFLERRKHLNHSFRLICERKAWKKYVKGGLVAFEATWRRGKGKGWHCHLHILYVGQYFPQAELQEVWQSVTKDSYLVDVRPVKIRKGRPLAVAALAEIVKYTLKDHSLPAERLAEFEAAMRKHGRVIRTFGCMWGCRPKSEKKKRVACAVCGCTVWFDVDAPRSGYDDSKWRVKAPPYIPMRI
jgi:hypothetical protein